MTVSIIIAVKTWQENLRECVDRCRQLDFPDFEIIILPDSLTEADPDTPGEDKPEQGIPLRMIPTGMVSPAKKRDIALNYAKGDILAFIDDDAYPQADWLKMALANFACPETAAVGGPAITPQTDSPRQKASGEIYASFLVSGPYTYRYLPGKKRLVQDYPSCNFLLRKSIMLELGGFKTNFWPGEDTKLCLEITHKLRKNIVYDPAVAVFHHRRPVFLPHLKQIASYALHRGYFVKRFPQTSLSVPYFLPSILFLGTILGVVLSVGFPALRAPYLYCLSFYILTVLAFSLWGGWRLFFLVLPGIILTHFTYGIYFLKGLVSARLKDQR